MTRFLIPLFALATTLSAAQAPADVLTAEIPADAVEVVAARAAAAPGATITVRGVIGGRSKPIADQRAVFTIIDRSLVCDTSCGTGWSGCSTTPENLKTGIATVQITDEAGKPLVAAIDSSSGLVPGATVTIRGTVAPASNADLLILTATAIHVEAAAN